jgi:hypothetical protein
MERSPGQEGLVTLMVHSTGKILSTNSMTISYFQFLVGQRERPTVRRSCIRAAYDFSQMTLAWAYPTGRPGCHSMGPYRHAMWRPVDAQQLPVTFPSPSLSRPRSTQALAPPHQRGHEQQVLSSLENVSSVQLVTLRRECGEQGAAANMPNVKGPIHLTDGPSTCSVYAPG